MEQKAVDFEVIKQKIIKTDELIRMYKQVVNKSRKLEQNFEILKKERKNNLAEIKRYELEKEMLEDSLTRTRGKKNQLEEENKELLNQKLILEDDFNKRIVGAMTTIRDLQHELKFREEMSLAAENFPKGKGKRCKESTKMSKLKENKCNCQEQKDSIQKLTFENKQLKEKIDEINKDHFNIIGQLQSQLNELKDCKTASLSFEEQVNILQTEINMVRLENDKLHDQLKNSESKFQSTTSTQQQVKSNETQSLAEKVNDTHDLPTVQDVLETDKHSQNIDENSHMSEMNINEDDFMSDTEENTENLIEPLHEDIKMPDINISDTLEEPNIEEILKEMTHCPIMLPPLSDDENEHIHKTVCSIQSQISVPGNIDAVLKQEVISNVNENVISEESDLPLPNFERLEETVQSKEMVDTIQEGYLFSLVSEKVVEEINTIFDKELVNNIKETVILEENNLPLTNSEKIDEEIVNNIQKNECIEKESSSIKKDQLYRRIINRNRQLFKKKLLLKKKQHLKMLKAKKRTKKTSDSIFNALQILQQANIKFTISNESTLPSNWSNNNFFKQFFTTNPSFTSGPLDNNTQSADIQHDSDLRNANLPETVIQTDNNQIREKLTCSLKNCKNSCMILRKFNKNTELLGFSHDNNCSSLDESKSNNITEHDIVKSQNIPEQLVDRLAELVSQKIMDTSKNFKRKRTKLSVSDQDSFTSETEPEIERLFERHDEDILQRNKILFKKAKGQYQESSSANSLESCNTQTTPEEFQQTLDANNDTILNSKEDSNVDNDEDSNESFKIPFCPQILSPISSVCSSPKNKIDLLWANEDVKIEKQLNASTSFDTEGASTVVLESQQANVEETLTVVSGKHPAPLQITKNISDILSNESVQNSPNSVDSGIESALTQSDSTDDSCELVSKTSLNRKDEDKHLPNETEYTDPVSVNPVNLLSSDPPQSYDLLGFSVKLPEDITEKEENYVMSGISADDILHMIPSEELHDDSTEGSKNTYFETSLETVENDSFECPLSPDMSEKGTEGYMPKTIPLENRSDLEVEYRKPETDEDIIKSSKPDEKTVIKSANGHRVLRRSSRKSKKITNSLYEYEHLSKRGSNKRKTEKISKQELEDIQEETEVTSTPDKDEAEVPDIAETNSSICNNIETEMSVQNVSTKRRPRPTTKLKSQILRQMRLQRRMYQNDAKVVGDRNIEIENSNVNSVESPIDTTETKECETANERVTFDLITTSEKQCSKVKILQNILIREAHSHYQVVPGGASMPSETTTNNKRNAGNTTPTAASENRGASNSCDILSSIMSDMNKLSGITSNNKPKTVGKPRIVSRRSEGSERPPDSCDILFGKMNETDKTENTAKTLHRRKVVTKKSKNSKAISDPDDVLSQIMNEMDKDRPQPVSKNNFPKKPVQLSIDDKQWRNNLLDIAEMTQNRADMETYFTNRPSYNLNAQLTTWMKKQLPAKERTLLTKLFEQSNEGQFPDEVIKEFKRLGVDATVNVILHRLSEDIYEKPDISCYPAPLMTKTQRLFLLLMLRLEQEKLCNLLETFLRTVENLLFRVRCKNWIMPFTRLYLGVCRLHGNINRMRMFCCEAFYYMGDLAVPLFYTVLKSWIEVMPKESDQQNFPLAKVLVQIINLKACNTPGYNLIYLRKLLLQYHGFPDQRWNCDEVFQELYQRFLREPSHSSEYAICLFCQHKTTKWVYKKINEYFKPLVYKIPAANVNFKASVILMMGKMVCGFKPNTFYDETCLVELRRFFLGLIETDDVHDLIRESVFLTLERLPKKKVVARPKKNKKPATINRKKNNAKCRKLKEKTVLESCDPAS